MPESKHTPGPWEARPQEGLQAVLIVSQNEHYKDQAALATVWTRGVYTNTAPANARLIAAAPDLLEACKVAVQNTSDAAMIYSQDDHGERVYLKDILNTAIARAEDRE